MAKRSRPLGAGAAESDEEIEDTKTPRSRAASTEPGSSAQSPTSPKASSASRGSKRVRLSYLREKASSDDEEAEDGGGGKEIEAEDGEEAMAEEDVHQV